MRRRKTIDLCSRRDFLSAFPLLAAGTSQIFSRKRAAVEPPVTPQGRVYIILSFDVDDYILPQSDDAAKRVAAFLTRQGIRATFKVVGEKARVLERRGRRDVIGALAEHEIGYHSNTHSQHPTVAEYESVLDWKAGVEEFTRREKAGFDDVGRIFGQTPTCYGQPGKSWAPQAFAALSDWGVKVYLAEGGQVGYDGQPFWYGGLLNIFNLRDSSKFRPNDDWSNLEEAKEDFQDVHLRLTSKRNGGLISLSFRPCEFVERQCWDEVNFARGANPVREEWKSPTLKSPGESERAFRYFEEIVTYMKSLPRVEFVTASQTLGLFSDSAQRRVYPAEDIGSIAGQVGAEISFQDLGDAFLSPSEIFYLLNAFVAQTVRKNPQQPILLDGIPYGPASEDGTALARPVEVPWGQFSRAVVECEDFLRKSSQIPSSIRLGGDAVRPESYLFALADVTKQVLEKAEPPGAVTIPTAKMTTKQYVAEDSPSLWDWIVFPPGFHAPELMKLAKLQAWTLKPARLRAVS